MTLAGQDILVVAGFLPRATYINVRQPPTGGNLGGYVFRNNNCYRPEATLNAGLDLMLLLAAKVQGVVTCASFKGNVPSPGIGQTGQGSTGSTAFELQALHLDLVGFSE